jgi:hypothetical protein
MKIKILQTACLFGFLLMTPLQVFGWDIGVHAGANYMYGSAIHSAKNQLVNVKGDWGPVGGAHLILGGRFLKLRNYFEYQDLVTNGTWNSGGISYTSRASNKLGVATSFLTLQVWRLYVMAGPGIATKINGSSSTGAIFGAGGGFYLFTFPQVFVEGRMQTDLLGGTNRFGLYPIFLNLGISI